MDPYNDEMMTEASLLVGILMEVNLVRLEENIMIWSYGGGNGCYVKSYYERLMQFHVEDAINESTDATLKIVWKAKVPHKVKYFACRIF